MLNPYWVLEILGSVAGPLGSMMLAYKRPNQGFLLGTLSDVALMPVAWHYHAWGLFCSYSVYLIMCLLGLYNYRGEKI